MERLTKRTIDGDAFFIRGYTRQFGEVADKLARYEDLEEEGRLLTLPCKEGDIIYVVGTKCLANVISDEECDMYDCDTCPYDEEKTVFEEKATMRLIMVIVLGDPNWIWNKTVFKTKAEAEKALAEMEK